MSNAVDDDLDLANFPKSDGTPPPVSGLDEELTAADLNNIRQYLLDLKNAHLGVAMTNVTGGLIAPGAPCYTSAASSVSKSKADAAATAECDGLAIAQFAIGGTGRLRSRGDMPLTTGQWDAVTGQTGGLTPNAVYYLDPATAGKLTTTAPSSGGFVTRVGRALSTTIMRLSIQPPIGL